MGSKHSNTSTSNEISVDPDTIPAAVPVTVPEFCDYENDDGEGAIDTVLTAIDGLSEWSKGCCQCRPVNPSDNFVMEKDVKYVVWLGAVYH